MSPLIGVEDLAPWQFDMYVGAEADGVATPEQLAALEANPVPWRASLLTMVREAEEHLASARTLSGRGAGPGRRRPRIRIPAAGRRVRAVDADPIVAERDTARRIGPAGSGAAACAIASPEQEPAERPGPLAGVVGARPGGGLGRRSARAGRRPRAGHGAARRGGRAGVGMDPAHGGAPARRWHRRRDGDPGRRRPRLARRRGRRSGRRRHRARASAGSDRSRSGRSS